MIISLCQFYCGILNFNRLYELQRFTFLSKLVEKSVINNSREIDRLDYKDFLTLQARYDLVDVKATCIARFKICKSFEVELFLNLIMICYCSPH